MAKNNKVVMEKYDYIDYDKILSYGALINMVVGDRGVGKSYGAKKWCIKRFLKKGEKFLYIKRYKSDLADIDKFFADLQDDVDINAHTFKVQGKKLFIDDVMCGEAIALSMGQSKKSTPYAEYNNMIFDEFILEQGVVRYLENEVSKFMSLIDTVVRNRSGCKVFVLGNSVKWANPYFVFYHFTPTGQGIQVKQDGTVLLANYVNESFRQKRRKTEVGRLIDGTKYGEMSLQSTYTDLNDDFIKKRSNSATLWVTMYWKGKYYGIWFDTDSYVISSKCNKEGRVLCYTKDDFKPNMYLLSDRKHVVNNALKRAFKYSYLYYEDIYIRDDMFDLLGIMGIR